MVLFDFLPLRLMPPLAFSVFAYRMIGLNVVPKSLSRPPRFAAALALGNMAASALSLAIGAATDSTAVANLVGLCGGGWASCIHAAYLPLPSCPHELLVDGVGVLPDCSPSHALPSLHRSAPC